MQPEANEWRPVAGFEDYEINRDGIVRRLKVVRGHARGTVVRPRPKRRHKSMTILLCDQDRVQRERVLADLVVRTFVGGPPEPHYELCYVDNDPLNVNASNLQWRCSEKNFVPDNGMEWRIIPGFEDYEIREDGLVRRRVASDHGLHLGCVVEPQLEDGGYLRICLYKDRRKFRRSVHTLVALAFVGPRPDKGLVLRHYDGNPLHNHHTNLLWGTPKQNMEDRDRHGRTARGEKSGMAKLSDQDIIDIRSRIIASGGKRGINRQLASEYNITEYLISKIKHGTHR